MAMKIDELKEVLYKNGIVSTKAGTYMLTEQEVVSIWNTAIEAAHNELVSGLTNDEDLGKRLTIGDFSTINGYLYAKSIK